VRDRSVPALYRGTIGTEHPDGYKDMGQSGQGGPNTTPGSDW